MLLGESVVTLALPMPFSLERYREEIVGKLRELPGLVDLRHHAVGDAPVERGAFSALHAASSASRRGFLWRSPGTHTAARSGCQAWARW